MKTVDIESNPVLVKTIQFSIEIIEYCEVLNHNKKFILSNQLLRSGTSIGANAMEAQNPESKADFVHKMKVAAKEADETQYWLILCSRTTGYPDCRHLMTKLQEIQKIINAILGSSKR